VPNIQLHTRDIKERAEKRSGGKRQTKGRSEDRDDQGCKKKGRPFSLKLVQQLL